MEDNEEEEKSSRTIELKNLLKKTEDEEESKKEHSISSPKHSNLKKVLISGVGFFSDAYVFSFLKKRWTENEKKLILSKLFFLSKKKGFVYY